MPSKHMSLPKTKLNFVVLKAPVQLCRRLSGNPDLVWKNQKSREITIGNKPLVSFDQRFEALGAGLVFTCVTDVLKPVHMRKCRCRNYQALTIKKRFGFTHLIWSKTVGVCVSELIKSVGSNLWLRKMTKTHGPLGLKNLLSSSDPHHILSGINIYIYIHT